MIMFILGFLAAFIVLMVLLALGYLEYRRNKYRSR